MERRALVIGLAAASLVPARARAQSPGRVVRLGLLMPGPLPATDPLIAALRLRGWTVGHNLVIATRYTQGDPQRAEDLTRELVHEGVDVIVTNFTATAMAARRVTSVIPIVMQSSGFPVEGGLAQTLARPGGNVTGMTVYAGGGPIFGKFVDLLRELVPSLRELGVFWGYAPPSYREEQVAPALVALNSAAKALSLTMRFWQTGTEAALEAALAAAARVPLDAVLFTGGVVHPLPENAARIASFISRRRVPALTEGRAVFAAGAVLGYFVDGTESAARTANFVDRILRGARPGELPIEQPTRYELVVNLKTARALGVDIPRSLVVRADRVIEQ
jgi:putative ABC transport system substrate-binding protein